MKDRLLLGLLLLILLVLAVDRTIASMPATVQGNTDSRYRISLQYGDFDTRLGEPVMPPSLHLDAYKPGEVGYYLVQFADVILPEWKNALEGAGAELLGYVPNNAFIVRMTQDQRALVAGLKQVQWIGIYQPAYRIAPWMPPLDEGEATVVVLTFPGTDLGQIVAQLEAWGGRILATAENEFRGKARVVTDLSYVPQIARLSGVMWIEPWLEPKLANDVARGIMNLEDTVWNVHGLYGAGQIVAVADTGLDVGRNDTGISADFEGRIVSAYALGRPGDWSDPNGHGTHVAGSAVGNGRNSGATPATHGYTGSYAGVAPEARLVFQSVMAADGLLSGLSGGLNNLLQQSYHNDGARIHTNSWGTAVAGQYDDDSFEVDQFIWNHPDMVVLFAAGNDGVDVATPTGVIDPNSVNSPGTAKNVITVGATENLRPSGGLDCTWACFHNPDDTLRFPNNPIRDDYVSNNYNGMAAFSSRGPVDGSRIKPDLVAPGTNILSTRTHQHTMNMDAESGTHDWTADAPWTITTALAHNGTHSWTTGPYGNNQNVSLTSPPMDIRTGADAIGFWTRYNLGAGDIGYVDYFSGTQWLSCPQQATGTQNNWTFMSCSLPQMEVAAMQNFSIRFRLQSDNADTGIGWYLDDILVTPQGWGFHYQAGEPNPHYMYMGGTSMATPLVAGAATLVREYYVRRGYAPSTALVKATLVNGAVNIAPGQYGTGATQEIPDIRPNNVTGWGRVNLQESLFPVAPQTVLYKDVANVDGINTTQSHVYRYEVRDRTVPFRATLVWTDHPALPPAGNPRINNDLDLIVRMPNGNLRYPNGRSNADPDNNTEDIFLNSADVIAGTYVITVTGRSVPNGPQGYALVVRGGNLREVNIAVNPPGFDDIGAILTQIGYPWVEVQDSNITQYERIQQFQTLFANCSGSALSTGPSAAASLRRFVQNGGSFYASDWAYTYVSSAFPGYINFRDSPRIGNSQYVNATIVDPGLANYLDPANPPSSIMINYNLDNWAVIDGVSPNTKVHLRGSFSTSLGQMNNKPLIVSFSPYGTSTGRVIYTTFHNEAQQTAIEKKLLEYLVLIPSTSQLVAQAEQIVKSSGLYVKQTNINTTDQGATSPRFTYNVAATTKLIFVCNWGGSTLRLSVFQPNGTLYGQVESSTPPTAITIPSAEPGAWKYQVSGVSVPYNNYPYVVVIGDQFPIGLISRAFLPIVLKNYPSWTPSSGLSGRAVYGITPVPANCNVVYAATDAGLYKSTDGSASWTPSGLNAVLAVRTLPSNAPRFQGTPASATLVSSVAVDHTNSQVVYAATWGSGVYKSTNGGGSWTPVNSGLSDPYIYTVATDPGQSNVVYAGGDSQGVFKTTNGGTSWSASNSGLGNLNIRYLAVAPSDRQVIYAGTAAGVYRSNNGGASWSATGTLGSGSVWALAIQPTDWQKVYAGLGGGGVYKSTNGGANWVAINNGLGSLDLRGMVIDPLNTQIIYAGTNGGGVFRSSDSATWTEFNTGLGNLTIKSLAMSSGSCHTLLAGTADGVWRH